MTIVLQYQFEDLSVDETTLSVTLSFNNIPEKLIVPLSAITIFADPSVNFALQFQPLSDMLDHEEEALAALAMDDDGDDEPPKGGKKAKKEGSGEVISLDQFRKK